MAKRIAQSTPSLTSTTFNPAYTDKSLELIGAQIWNGPTRNSRHLVADCVNDIWAQGLVVAYNSYSALMSGLATSNQMVAELLFALEAQAKTLQASNPELSDSLTKVAVEFRAKAKRSGINLG